LEEKEQLYNGLTLEDLQELLEEIRKPIPRNIDIRLRISLI
jgi:hypothetical protein